MLLQNRVSAAASFTTAAQLLHVLRTPRAKLRCAVANILTIMLSDVACCVQSSCSVVCNQLSNSSKETKEAKIRLSARTAEFLALPDSPALQVARARYTREQGSRVFASPYLQSVLNLVVAIHAVKLQVYMAASGPPPPYQVPSARDTSNVVCSINKKDTGIIDNTRDSKVESYADVTNLHPDERFSVDDDGSVESDSSWVSPTSQPVMAMVIEQMFQDSFTVSCRIAPWHVPIVSAVILELAHVSDEALKENMQDPPQSPPPTMSHVTISSSEFISVVPFAHQHNLSHFVRIFEGRPSLGLRYTVGQLRSHTGYILRARLVDSQGVSLCTPTVLTIETPAKQLCTLDPSNCGPNLMLSEGNMTITNTVNKKWNSVRATTALTHGVHRWTVRIDKCCSKNIFVGVVRASAPMDNYVGSDKNGWGYLANRAIWYNKSKVKTYGELFREGDRITVTLDLDRGVIGFARNGRDIGVAVEGLSGEFFPAFSLYNREDQITLLTSASSLTGQGAGSIIHAIASGLVDCGDLATLLCAQQCIENRSSPNLSNPNYELLAESKEEEKVELDVHGVGFSLNARLPSLLYHVWQDFQGWIGGVETMCKLQRRTQDTRTLGVFSGSNVWELDKISQRPSACAAFDVVPGTAITCENGRIIQIQGVGRGRIWWSNLGVENKELESGTQTDQSEISQVLQSWSLVECREYISTAKSLNWKPRIDKSAQLCSANSPTIPSSRLATNPNKDGPMESKMEILEDLNSNSSIFFNCIFNWPSSLDEPLLKVVNRVRLLSQSNPPEIWQLTANMLIHGFSVCIKDIASDPHVCALQTMPEAHWLARFFFLREWNFRLLQCIGVAELHDVVNFTSPVFGGSYTVIPFLRNLLPSLRPIILDEVKRAILDTLITVTAPSAHVLANRRGSQKLVDSFQQRFATNQFNETMDTTRGSNCFQMLPEFCVTLKDRYQSETGDSKNIVDLKKLVSEIEEGCCLSTAVRELMHISPSLLRNGVRSESSSFSQAFRVSVVAYHTEDAEIDDTKQFAPTIDLPQKWLYNAFFVCLLRDLTVPVTTTWIKQDNTKIHLNIRTAHADKSTQVLVHHNPVGQSLFAMISRLNHPEQTEVGGSILIPLSQTIYPFLTFEQACDKDSTCTSLLRCHPDENFECHAESRHQVFKVIGRVIGIALRSGIRFNPFLYTHPSQRPANKSNITFARLFWKALLGSHPTIEDIREIDPLCTLFTTSLRDLAKKHKSDPGIIELVCPPFIATSINGGYRELFLDGSQMRVRADQLVLYADLIEKAKIHELDQELKAIVMGFQEIIPPIALALMTWNDLEKLLIS